LRARLPINGNSDAIFRPTTVTTPATPNGDGWHTIGVIDSHRLGCRSHKAPILRDLEASGKASVSSRRNIKNTQASQFMKYHGYTRPP
jgi:hypothetical protein